MRRIPSFAAILLMLGTLAAPALAQQRDWAACNRTNVADAAITACSDILRDSALSSGDAANAHNGRGFAYLEKNDLDRAIRDFDDAIRLNANLATAYKGRGQTYFLKGDHDGAVRDLDSAIRLDAKHSAAYSWRGYVYNTKKDYDQAIRDYDEAIRLRPSDAATRTNRGNSYYAKGEYDRAIQDYDEVLRLSPGNATAVLSRGNAYSAKKDYDKAIKDYEEAIRIDPRRTSAYNGRGLVYQARKEFDRAIRDFDEVIRLDPKFAEGYSNRGFCYYSKRDYDRAIRDYDEAISLNPRSSVAFYNRGFANEAKGARERAIADFKVVLSLPDAGFFGGIRAHVNARERLTALEGQQATARPQTQAQTQTQTQAQPQIQGQYQGQSQAQSQGQGQTQIQSAPGKRVALVIGNSAYSGRAKLSNPANDAEDVAAALTKLGFEVTKGQDVSLSAFGQMIASFRDKAVGADVALFYYAGHGMQFDDQNWLLPVDSQAKNLFEARRQFVSLNEAISEVEARAGATLVFLDSCRDNPLEEDLKANLKAQGRSGGETRGLTRPDIRSPQTMMVFATRPNTTAADGYGRNSPFTEAFLQHVATPGVEIEVLMKRVSASVASKTKGKQQPERLSRLETEFYFVPAR